MPFAAERFTASNRCAIVSPEPVKIEAVNVFATARKLGAAGRVASRLTNEAATRNRTFGAVMNGVRATTRSFRVAMHQLWHEVTGTVFLAMAAMGGVAGGREYMKYHAGQTTAGRVAVAAAFTLTFAWFGLSSFWRVRKKG
jgi:hypothetical protein